MRVLLLSAALALGASSLVLAPAATAADSYTVTASVSANSVDVGQAFTVRGHISPTARHEYAVVQRQTSTGWTRVARDAINKYGNYRATVTVPDPGDHVYRVLKRHSHGHLRGVSATFTVTGWHWRALSSLPTTGTVSAVSFPASGQLGPTAYPVTFSPFIKLDDLGTVTYVLAKQCSRFEGEVGVTTDSATDTDQTAMVSTLPQVGDPTQIVGQVVRRNQDPAHVVRSGAVISDAWALNLARSGTSGNYVGWGDPRVYCKS